MLSIVLGTCLGAFATCVTVWRLIYRRLDNKIWWDDAWAAFAMLNAWILVACVWIIFAPEGTSSVIFSPSPQTVQLTHPHHRFISDSKSSSRMLLRFRRSIHVCPLGFPIVYPVHHHPDYSWSKQEEGIISHREYLWSLRCHSWCSEVLGLCPSERMD